ncbi:MAG: hypothetical protein AAGJ87_17390, partial [Pseudomonadota bacterium]
MQIFAVAAMLQRRTVFAAMRPCDNASGLKRTTSSRRILIVNFVRPALRRRKICAVYEIRGACYFQ